MAAMIKKSVGRNCANDQEDVKIVQRLLGSPTHSPVPLRPPQVTGVCNDITIGLIEQFQRSIRLPIIITGRIEPGDSTWSELSLTSTPVTTVTQAKEAIQLFESTAINFAARTIPDARVREGYVASAQKYSQELLTDIQAGKLSPAEAAERANLVRNELLDASRLKSSDVGKAIAEKLKKHGKTLVELQEHYAVKKFQKAFSALESGERNEVFLEIVRASGRPNSGVTRWARGLGRAGRGVVVVAIAVSVYNIATADDPAKETAREGVGLGAGFAGSVAGGALAGLACGPGAPACVAVGAFVGGVLFALGADFSFDKLAN